MILSRKLLSYLLLFCVFAGNLVAFEFRKGDELYLSEDFEEDLFIAGSKLNFDGNLVGDLAAFSWTVTFDGKIDGNLMAFTQRATIGGEICRSVRCFAESGTINGIIEGDLLAFCSDLTLSSESAVSNDVAVYAGVIFVDGAIGGNAYFHGGRVSISGKIDGDVKISSDKISIGPDAVIGGNLSYESKTKANISPEAQILGETRWKKVSRSSQSTGITDIVPPPGGIFWTSIFFCGALLLGVILILLRRDAISALTQEIKGNLVIDSLVGFFVILIIPIILVLTGVTLIGLPLAFVGFSFYAFTFFVAKILTATALGMVILGLIKKNGKISLGWSLVLGLVVFAFLFKVPILGWLIYFEAWSVGVGAMTMMIFRRKKPAVIAMPLS